MTPGFEQGHKERLTVSGIEIPEPSPQISQFWGRDGVVVQVLDHDAREFDVLYSGELRQRAGVDRTHLVFLETVGHGAVYPFGAERDAQLSYDEVPPGFEQSSVGAEEFQQVDHERGEVGVVAVLRDLGEQEQVARDDGFGGIGQSLEQRRKCSVLDGKNLVVRSQCTPLHVMKVQSVTFRAPSCGA